MDKETFERLGKQLHRASLLGGLDEVKHLLKEHPELVTWKDSNGSTSLHWACSNNYAAITDEILQHNPDVNAQAKNGESPVHSACYSGSIDCLKLLMTTGQCDLGLFNSEGRTPLGDAVYMGRVTVVKYLISEHSVDVNAPVTNYAANPLGLAVKIDVIRCLVTELNADVNEPVLLKRVLEMAVFYRDVELMKHLLTEKRVDINEPDLLKQVLEMAVRRGDVELMKHLVTERRVEVNEPALLKQVLEMAVLNGDVELMKQLVTEQRVEVNDELLILASKENHVDMVRFFLAELHLNPNIKNKDGQTPLSVVRGNEIIQLLLQHGAQAKDAYVYHRKASGRVFSKDPLKSPVKIFVMGQSGEGKSTLIEAMEKEPTFLSSVSKEVDGLSKSTAGIIPRVFQSRIYGDVLFYDFAGQEAYYSSHAAIIKNIVDTCPPIFLLVIGLHRDDTTTTQSVSYWLQIVVNQCANIEGKAPLIVVGSRADQVSDGGEINRKKQIIVQAVQKFPSFELVDIVPIDCRWSNSPEMKILRHHVGTSSASICTKLSVSLNSHMFLIYLLDEFPGEVAVTLEDVQSNLKSPKKADKKRVLPFIPDSSPHLIEICVQLSDKGHILLLHNTSTPAKSFIIIDKAALLARINGSMFAPDDFKEHCQLASSTGVVPKAKLAEHFPSVPIDVLIGFLEYLELAVPIEDDVLEHIERHMGSESQIASSNGFLFCPALIRLTVPRKLFKRIADLACHFGWILSCVRDKDFLNPRFLHVLLLRIPQSLGLSPEIQANIPALQHQCSVWTTGISWSTSQGAEVLLEVVDQKKVVVLIQVGELSQELLKLRSDIIQKVRRATSELCPSVRHHEQLLPPSAVEHPLDESDLIKFNMKSVAESVVNMDCNVMPTTVSSRPLAVSHLLPAEVYANLGENILQALFNETDPSHNKVLSNTLLSALVSTWSRNPHLLKLISATLKKVPPPNSSEDELIHTTPSSSPGDTLGELKIWRDRFNGTPKVLRLILDPLSVFAGKNPLELANVPVKEFREDLLPHHDQTVIQHTNPSL